MCTLLTTLNAFERCRSKLYIYDAHGCCCFVVSLPSPVSGTAQDTQTKTEYTIRRDGPAFVTRPFGGTTPTVLPVRRAELWPKVLTKEN